MLRPLNGATDFRLSIPDLRLIADLIHFDGPLLSYFRDTQEQHYLFYWCDADGLHNRWLVFRSTAPLLNQFFTRQITLRDLILAADPNALYLVDIDDRLNFTSTSKVRFSSLPQNYLPDGDTLYDASLTRFHDDQAARDLIVLMQKEAQVTQTRLLRFEQAASKNPEIFRELLVTP